MFSTLETIALCLAVVVIGFDQGWRWQRRVWQRRLVDGTYHCVAKAHRFTNDRICRECGLLQPPTIQLAANPQDD